VCDLQQPNLAEQHGALLVYLASSSSRSGSIVHISPDSTVLAPRRLRQTRILRRLSHREFGCLSVPSSASWRRDRHVSCGELAIVRWISSESVRAPIFFMAVARWVSTVLWLMPRT
jgi:hypothetical protein